MTSGRTKQDLLAASEHLHYEITMFGVTAQVLTTGAFVGSLAQNAFLESFTIHTRSLLQFFFPQNPKPDDVIASHYFTGTQTWVSVAGQSLPPALDQINRRVGKEIAHLTYARLQVTPAAKAWNIGQIYGEMGKLIKAFQAGASQDCLGPSWPRRVITTPAPTATNAITSTTSKSDLA